MAPMTHDWCSSRGRARRGGRSSTSSSSGVGSSSSESEYLSSGHSDDDHSNGGGSDDDQSNGGGGSDDDESIQDNGSESSENMGSHPKSKKRSGVVWTWRHTCDVSIIYSHAGKFAMLGRTPTVASWAVPLRKTKINATLSTGWIKNGPRGRGST
uniref:Uncharacterized protein n=1 Tax=Arundo donax TaxID=35708 RepID=A0A0A8Y6N3_ARUDO